MFGCEGDEAQAIRPFGLSATNVMETTLAIGGLPRGVGSPRLLLPGRGEHGAVLFDWAEVSTDYGVRCWSYSILGLHSMNACCCVVAPPCLTGLLIKRYVHQESVN